MMIVDRIHEIILVMPAKCGEQATKVPDATTDKRTGRRYEQ
jgi:hypothetical protein